MLTGSVGLGVLTLPVAALAASIPVLGTVQGSVLSVSVSSTAPSFTANLDTGDATSAYSVSLATQDTRGTGSGWDETVDRKSVV